MNFKRIYAVFKARNLEFVRDKAAFSWSIIFPVVSVVVMGFAFDDDNTKQYTVGVLSEENVLLDPERNSTAENKSLLLDEYSGGLIGKFLSYKHIDMVPFNRSSLENAISKVSKHTLDLLIDPINKEYWVNVESPKGYLIEKVFLQSRNNSSENVLFNRSDLTGKKVRYIDWLIPGMLCMNIMFSALWGIGFVIVRYRKNGVLKRFRASPLTPSEFLIAQMISRIWLLVVVNTILFVGLDVFFDFQMHGSYFDLFLVFLIGAVSLLSVSLIMASVLTSEELASGILNLISWPMMFLSGLWFSLEGAHPILKQVAMIFPLTHVTSAARSIMLDGKGLGFVYMELGVLVIVSTIFLFIGTRIFRWE